MKNFLLFSWICALTVSSLAQTGSTGIGTTAPHTSSILDINSNDKGVLLPRVSSSQRKSIVSPAAGLLVYDVDKRTIFLYDGTQWLPMMIAASNTNTLPETIVPDNVQGDEHAGYSVAVSGNYAILGANKYNEHQGTAYIYFKQNGIWTQQAKLFASDGAIEDRFGSSVAINGDWAVVGAYSDDVTIGIPPFVTNYPDRGSIYIFQRNGTNWTQTARLNSTTTNTSFYGMSIAMDGDRLVVGSVWEDGTGAAYVYQRNGNLWALQQRIVATDGLAGDEFGSSIDIKGHYIIVGAPGDDFNAIVNSGSAYVFYNNGIFWAQQQKIAGGDEGTDLVGCSVAINDSLALVGNSTKPINGLAYHGEVKAYRRNGTNWSTIATLGVPDGIADARIGWAIAMHGEVAIVAANGGFGNLPGQGTCYVYKYIDGQWRFQHKINEPQGTSGMFGYSVALDGMHIIVGIPFRPLNKGGAAFVSYD